MKTGHHSLGLLLTAMVLASVLFAPTITSSAQPAPVTAWYEALRNNDKTAFESLLDKTATIELRDLGVTQTRAEFILSLDHWIDANSNATILTRPLDESDQGATLEVCYRFASNEILMKESFEISDMKISKSTQEQLSENCGDFQ